jgi:hypothetical protein
MIVFTIVTEETNEIALPFNTASAPGRVLAGRQCNSCFSNNGSYHYTTTSVVDNAVLLHTSKRFSLGILWAL